MWEYEWDERVTFTYSYPVVRIDDRPASVCADVGVRPGPNSVGVITGVDGTHVVFYVLDPETVAHVRAVAVTMTVDERETLLALARDWHGSVRDILSAAKAL